MSAHLLEADPILAELEGVFGEVDAGNEKVGNFPVLDLVTDEEEEISEDAFTLVPGPAPLAVEQGSG